MKEKKSLHFDVGKCYTVTKIKNTSIYLVDDTKEEHEWNYNYFFKSFSLPNTLQVSQTQEDVRSYNVGQSDSVALRKIRPDASIFETYVIYDGSMGRADKVKSMYRYNR